MVSIQHSVAGSGHLALPPIQGFQTVFVGLVRNDADRNRVAHCHATIFTKNLCCGGGKEGGEWKGNPRDGRKGAGGARKEVVIKKGEGKGCKGRGTKEERKGIFRKETERIVGPWDRRKAGKGGTKEMQRWFTKEGREGRRTKENGRT